MKMFLDLSSWSRKAAIGSMLIMAFAFVGCDDSSSASAGPNDEPGVESSSSSSGKAGEPAEPAEVTSSSSEKAKSSSSDAQSDAEQSSSSEKSGKSSCSTDDASSSSVALATPCKTETEDNCEYGTVLDDRDGQTYKTVKIGDQWWMAENLNYKTDNSFCYKDKSANCTKYGRHYAWAAAMDSVGTWSTNGKGCGYRMTCSPTYPVRGVCPEGWHLPDTTEWNTLFTAVGGSSVAGTKLKSTSGWTSNGNGTDAFSFSALPAGGSNDWGDFNFEGFNAYFWSSTEDNHNYACKVDLNHYNGNAMLRNNYKSYVFPVRCVKD
ncbi:MAG: fibrobacter succinogenes major paralogous domain-containing protein [Fibrobacter sp.]|nr:fibrobacter succinogenes major paralogous domain-containing protein [Fibrobacter sp.]